MSDQLPEQRRFGVSLDCHFYPVAEDGNRFLETYILCNGVKIIEMKEEFAEGALDSARYYLKASYLNKNLAVFLKAAVEEAMVYASFDRRLRNGEKWTAMRAELDGQVEANRKKHVKKKESTLAKQPRGRRKDAAVWKRIDETIREYALQPEKPGKLEFAYEAGFETTSDLDRSLKARNLPWRQVLQLIELHRKVRKV